MYRRKQKFSRKYGGSWLGVERTVRYVELRRVLNDPVCTVLDAIASCHEAHSGQRMQMKTKMEGVYALPDRC